MRINIISLNQVVSLLVSDYVWMCLRSGHSLFLSPPGWWSWRWRRRFAPRSSSRSPRCSTSEDPERRCTTATPWNPDETHGVTGFKIFTSLDTEYKSLLFHCSLLTVNWCFIIIFNIWYYYYYYLLFYYLIITDQFPCFERLWWFNCSIYRDVNRADLMSELVLQVFCKKVLDNFPFYNQLCKVWLYTSGTHWVQILSTLQQHLKELETTEKKHQIAPYICSGVV